MIPLRGFLCFPDGDSRIIPRDLSSPFWGMSPQRSHSGIPRAPVFPVGEEIVGIPSGPRVCLESLPSTAKKVGPIFLLKSLCLEENGAYFKGGEEEGEG